MASAGSSAVRDRMRGEGGYSLVELLLVTMLLTIVLGAILALLDSTNRTAPKETERAHVIRETQVGLKRMTNELRHAYALNSTGPWSIDANVLVRGVNKRVVYDCADPDPVRTAHRRCMRHEVGSGGATTTPEPVVTRVLLEAPEDGGAPPAIFSFVNKGSQGVVYVTARLAVDAGGDLTVGGYQYPIVLDDGFYLRNRDA